MSAGNIASNKRWGARQLASVITVSTSSNLGTPESRGQTNRNSAFGFSALTNRENIWLAIAYMFSARFSTISSASGGLISRGSTFTSSLLRKPTARRWSSRYDAITISVLGGLALTCPMTGKLAPACSVI